jgi:L-asparaginase II
MTLNPFPALVEVTRGPLIESIHYGALAVVDSHGSLIASCGDPDLVANLRSSAKPFQALPLIENGGAELFGMTEREISLVCASHAGTDDHVSVLSGLQAKIGVGEINLLCGTHPPMDEDTARSMLINHQIPTGNRHNCSGKHTGMLAQAVLTHQPTEEYLDNNHKIQKTILKTFAEMLDMPVEEVLIGIDGCSAPTFAAPLRNGALGFARLADPSQMPKARASALLRIRDAMMAHPDMVAGPNRFDTRLMEVGQGKIVCKGGAEGYQGIGVLPGVLGPGSPGFGIAYKVIDGDSGGRARPVVGIAILRQLGVLSDEQAAELQEFDARPIYNWRKLKVGEIRPAFTLEKTPAAPTPSV